VELFEASSPEELIGIEGHTLQRQQFTPEEMAVIVEAINTQGIWSKEIEYISKTGRLFWGNLAVKRINVVDQAVNLVRVTDITERKQAQKQQELQAVITNNMAEGICLVRVDDGTIVYANPKFNRMFGYAPGELNGQHVSVVNYASDHISAEEVNRIITQSVMENGEVTYEVQNVKKDGTPFWCRATTSEFEHPDYGSVLVAVQQDITEHKQAEEQIKNSLKEKDVLLKEIHHRVKNNLQIVSSLLQMQSRRTQEPQAIEVLRDSKNRIASIALVHEKLYRSEDLANIDFGQYIPDLTTHLFDTYDVSSTTVSLNIQVDNISLQIDTAIPCGLIINELVSNSLKYAFPPPRKGEIQVQFYANNDNNLTLIIRDNGIGIPETFDIETTQSLGLTLVQGLVEQIEGTLELNRSQGTEFKITFPGG
jgi:PAS domain S-box-containing protein